MSLLETMVARWSAPDARPLFKGMLIDANGCCCAQGLSHLRTFFFLPMFGFSHPTELDGEPK